MTIVRTVHDKKNPYAIINKKALWDKELSLDAVGLWARLLSRPDDWKICVLELIKSCGCGKDKIYRILNELIEKGYAFREQTKHNGKFISCDFYVFENKMSKEEIQKMFPQRDFPDTVIPDPDMSVSGNTDTTNTDLLNTEEELFCVAAPHWEKIEKVDCEGKKFSISRHDLVTVATQKRKDWSLDEIQEIWEILCKYQSPLRDWFSFCDGTLEKLRRVKAIKKLNESPKEYNVCKTQKTSNSQSSKTKNNTLAQDMKAQPFLNCKFHNGIPIKLCNT